MSLLIRNIVISLIILNTVGCSPIFNYVASGKDSPRDKTVIYTDENGIRLRLSGLIYYINQSPELHETILRIEGSAVGEQLELLPESVNVDFYHDERSLIKSEKAVIKKVYTSAQICGNRQYADEIRPRGLPTPIVVPQHCDFSIQYRYFFEMPGHPKKVEVYAEFEYKTRKGNVRVNRTMEVNLKRERFWWIYAT